MARLQPRLLLGFLAALTALPASGDTGQVVWAELTTVAHVSTILFADKRGATRPEEVVIAGAHHDAKVVTLAAPQDGTSWVTGNLVRSDHGPFWLTERSAVFMSDTANFRNPQTCRPRRVMPDSTTREAPMRGTINPV